MFITNQKKAFIFPIKSSKEIYCEKITIKEYTKIDNLLNDIRSISKSLIFLFLFLFLWLYIALFIRLIYKRFRENIFKIYISCP